MKLTKGKVVKNQPKPKRTEVSLRAEVHARLKQEADKRNMTMTAMLELILMGAEPPLRTEEGQ